MATVVRVLGRHLRRTPTAGTRNRQRRSDTNEPGRRCRAERCERVPHDQCVGAVALAVRSRARHDDGIGLASEVPVACVCTARSSFAVRGSIAAGVATLIVLLTGACAPDRLPRPDAPAPSAPFTVVNPPTPAIRSVICTGSEAQDLLRTLFADIDAGRTPTVASYFTTPDAFLSWWDPTLVPDSVIT